MPKDIKKYFFTNVIALSVYILVIAIIISILFKEINLDDIFAISTSVWLFAFPAFLFEIIVRFLIKKYYKGNKRPFFTKKLEFPKIVKIIYSILFYAGFYPSVLVFCVGLAFWLLEQISITLL